MFRQAGLMVAKVLAEMQPANLSVERSLDFALVVNSKRRKALGLTIALTILAWADEVIDKGVNLLRCMGPKMAQGCLSLSCPTTENVGW